MKEFDEFFFASPPSTFLGSARAKCEYVEGPRGIAFALESRACADLRLPRNDRSEGILYIIDAAPAKTNVQRKDEQTRKLDENNRPDLSILFRGESDRRGGGGGRYRVGGEEKEDGTRIDFMIFRAVPPSPRERVSTVSRLTLRSLTSHEFTRTFITGPRE